jgi:hypothetical protein
VDILYNGVHLSMCTIDEYKEEQVYDPSGVDYLFTRHRIVGTAVVNGQAEMREVAGPPVSYERSTELFTAPNLYKASAPPGTPDDPAAGNINLNSQPNGVYVTATGQGIQNGGDLGTTFPNGGVYARRTTDLEYFALIKSENAVPLTHQAIRHRLAVPRAPLFVFAGTGDPTNGELLLRSPARFGDQCDAHNGPKPLFCDIIWSLGEADTHLIQFGIETYINESHLQGPDDDALRASPLLSNRFSMRHTVTEDQICYIDVEGEAYFRTDGVYGGTGGLGGFLGGGIGVNPDSYRINLFLPVPFLFVRGNIVVEGMPGTNGVRYAFQDRQMPVQFPGGVYHGATRVEAVHTQAIITDTDLIHAGAQLFHGFTDRLLNNKWLNDGANPRSGGTGKFDMDAFAKAFSASFAKGFKKP